MNVTPIEWTTFSANPLKFRTADGRVVWACEKVSPGCKNCYAEHLSTRYGGSRRAGDWNASTMATLTPFLDEDELHKMLTAKTVGGIPVPGSKCFPFDMTDLFGEWVPDALIDRVFAVFALRPDVTFQILTKRAERMHAYLTARDVALRWLAAIYRYYGRHADDTAYQERDAERWMREGLENVWPGVSCEDHPHAEKRIRHVLDTPAAARWVSYEPALAGINFRELHLGNGVMLDAMTGCHSAPVAQTLPPRRPPLDWIVMGGESGAGARPVDIDWFRSVIKQRSVLPVRLFVKQLGAWPMEGWTAPIPPLQLTKGRHKVAPFLTLRDQKGGDFAEWPADLKVREYPTV